MSLIIGVDGGGTKTIYKVFDRDENKTYEFIGPSINFYSVGDTKACTVFSEMMDEIEKSLQKKCDSIYIGNAALGIGDELMDNHPFMQQVARYTPHFKVVSDLYIGLKGVGSSPAIFQISGTGSMGIAESESGELFTIGGWGPLLGDQGSGYYVGLMGIRDAIKAYEKIGGKTVLVNKLKAFFSIDKLDDIIEKVYNPPIKKNVIAGFAVDVIMSAEQGDAVSIKIVETSVNYLVKYIIQLHNKLNKVDVCLGVYGGCFQKSDYFFELFKNSLGRERKNITVKFPEYSPDQAALILAGKLIKVEIPKNVL
ncbi:MAG TPA: BadF/BadG/BcrA/BcrD ATPase family protein [Victivallales bacterium]|nr:BadF/BadG/BcrA/BcrD ATPase family protein [Victivallales bacterium]